MDKRSILQGLKLGSVVAEDEKQELGSYFVETIFWQRLFNGEIDIVYGPKGSGKSAIYSLLIDRKNDLLDKSIKVIFAENPRGATVFGNIKATENNLDENEFKNLWKLYFLSLIAQELRSVKNHKIKLIVKQLEDSNIIPRQETQLVAVFNGVLRYIKSIVKAEAIEGEVQIDPNSGAPIFTGRVLLKEPNTEQIEKGFSSIDNLFRQLETALDEEDLNIWVAIDRLDVAFSDSSELEHLALKSLFKVYSDLGIYERIKLKVFLRVDIWRSLVNGGFREATHSPRSMTLSWDDKSLMNVIISRFLSNQNICDFYGVSKEEILSDIDKQCDLFYRIFPNEIEKRQKSFDWILKRIADGKGTKAPRELIHMIKEAVDLQIHKIGIGSPIPSEDRLLDNTAIKEAVPKVSSDRLLKTLYAEHHQYIEYIDKLKGRKTTQKLATLSYLWKTPENTTLEIAMTLSEIGFFKSKKSQVFEIPYLYRSALGMVQGTEKIN